MAETIGKLANAAIAVANTEQSFYVAQAGEDVAASSIIVCNKNASAQTFRIAHVAGGSDPTDAAADEYLFYDCPIAAKGTMSIKVGLAMNAADEIRINGSSTDLVISMFGSTVK